MHLSHLWELSSITSGSIPQSKRYYKDWCTKSRRLQHQLLQDVPSNTSLEESDGEEPAELQLLVLEFDHYREPVLRYTDDD